MPRQPRLLGGQRCTALTTKGQPCRAYAVRGATVCRAHGAAAPQVRAAAAARVERARVQRDVARTLAEVEDSLVADGVSPIEVLENTGIRAAAMVVVLSSMIDDLTTPTGDGETRSAVADLYERWVALAGKLAKTTLDAGVEERREQALERAVTLLEALVDALGAEVAGWLDREGVDDATVERLRSSWRPLVGAVVRAMGGSPEGVAAARRAVGRRPLTASV